MWYTNARFIFLTYDLKAKWILILLLCFQVHAGFSINKSYIIFCIFIQFYKQFICVFIFEVSPYKMYLMEYYKLI